MLLVQSTNMARLHLVLPLLLLQPDLSLPHPPTPGLEVLGVDVPKYVQLGADAALHCSYSSTSPVYSVRWYKGGKEFYSFLPGKRSPISVHRMKGVRVDATHSNISSVCLSSVSTTTTGRFRCEVSEEAPSFATDSKFGDLLVVVVPHQPPTISGAQARYRRGEEVELNCTVAATMPPANISWYINHRLVKPGELERHPVLNWTQAREGRLHTVTVGLHHKLTRHDFRHSNGVKFKCVASIYDAYYKVNEISAERGRRRRRVSGRRSLGQGGGGSGLVQVGAAVPLSTSASSSFIIILTQLWPLNR